MAINEVVEELKNSKRVMILSHHNADLDSICPSVVLKHALESIGKEADVGTAESTSKSVKKLVSDVKINPKLDEWDTIVTVDCASPEQLEPIEIKNKLLVIDHHSLGKLSEMSHCHYINPDAQTCTLLVLDVIRELGYQLTPEDASLIVAGIVGDTNHLRLATPEIFREVSKLLEISDKSYAEILDMMRTEQDISEKIAFIKSAKRVKSYQIGDRIITFTKAGSFEAPIARAFLRTGTDIAIVSTIKKDVLRISSRMKWDLRDKINLADEVFHPLEDLIGGSAGGHDAAASANGKNIDKIDEIFAEMLKLIEKKLGKAKPL